jgi:hypothetical protein
MLNLLKIFTLLLNVIILSGCMATMNPNALNSTNKVPNDEGYHTYTKLIEGDEAYIQGVLRKMKAIVKLHNKTQRSRSYTQAAKTLYSSATRKYLNSFGRDLNTMFNASADIKRAIASATYVEPSEVSQVQGDAQHPLNKKFSIEMQEYDVINGCQNSVKKLFSGFEKRYLYFGAIKKDAKWLFYLSLPSMKVHYPDEIDKRKGRCSSFYIGPEVHASLLGSLLRTHIDTL